MTPEDQREPVWLPPGNHWCTNWARWAVHHHRPIPACGTGCAICRTESREDAVVALLEDIDNADGTDIQLSLIRWPLQDEIIAAFVWWHTGGRRNWLAIEYRHDN